MADKGDVVDDCFVEYKLSNRDGPWSFQVSQSAGNAYESAANLNRSKYHVPLQIINTAVFYFARHFGHHHGGRQFPATVHGIMGSIVTWIVFIVCRSSLLQDRESVLTREQVVIGVFLKLHIMEKTIRRYIVPIHSILGKLFPLVGWTRELLPNLRRD